MKGLNRLIALENCKEMKNSIKSGPSQKKFIDYLLLLLIFIFFALPLSGLSLHYYKFGLPPRLLGYISLLLNLLK